MPSKHAIIWTLILSLLGFLGNFLHVPLFFGVDYVFGSIFVLLAASILGPVYGLLTGLLAHSFTVTLWNHPYALLSFVLEALFVGILIRRGFKNLFLADLLYWIIIGVPLVWPFYGILLDMETTQVLLIHLKQPANGLANAIMAQVLLLLLRFSPLTMGGRLYKKVALGEVVFAMALGLVMITTLGVTVINSRMMFQDHRKSLRSRLLSTETRLVSHIRHLDRNLETGNHYLLELHRERGGPLELVDDDLPDFIYLRNDSENELMALRKGLERDDIPPFQSEIPSRGFCFPSEDPAHVYHIQRIENYTLIAAMTITRFMNHLFVDIDELEISHYILDPRGDQLFHHLNAHARILSHEELQRAMKIEPETINHLLPGEGLPSMVRWKDSHFISRVPLPGENRGLSLVTAVSLSGFVDRLQQYYMLQFIMMLSIVLLIIPLVQVVRNNLTRSLESLADVTRELPERLRMGRPLLEWKSSRIQEVDILSSTINRISRVVIDVFSEQEEKYRALFNRSGEAVVVIDPENYIIIDANSRAAALFGKSLMDLKLAHFTDLFPEGQGESLEEMVRSVDEGRKPENRDFFVETAGGVFSLRLTPISAMMRDTSVMFVIMRDITQRLRSENDLLLSATVFENIEEGIVITDSRLVIARVNPAFEQITGFTQREVTGRKLDSLGERDHETPGMEEMAGTLTRLGHWQGELWNRKKNGELYAVWLTVTSVRDRDGRISNYIGVFIDITEKKRDQERIHHLALYDILTGLPNRDNFHERLKHVIQRSRRNRSTFALMYIDMDNFKTINETLGHRTGDQLILEMSERIQDMIRENDELARLGGDEFTLITEGIGDSSGASSVAKKILDTLDDPFILNEKEYYVTVSIGICLYPEDGEDVETLMRNADAALYRAKAAGRKGFEFYHVDMNTMVREKLELESGLRNALKNNELSVYYQPQINITTGKIVGAEALLRWSSPERGNVPPDLFIPVAEETGLIDAISNWLVDQVCRDLEVIMDSGLPRIRISINVADHQFRNEDFAETLTGIIRSHELDPAIFELELTERIFMENIEMAREKLRKLKEAGFTISIDDFGTGNSSLAHLKRFDIDTLKIDRSFVIDLPSDRQSGDIVLAIISMARALNMKVIAEGVEDERHLDLLRDKGCDEYQGYFFSRPVDRSHFRRLFRENYRMDEKD